MTALVVIGGGVAGASAAYRAVRSGASVTLIDRGDVGQATAAGAGIIAPGSSLRPLPAFYPFGRHAARFYPELIASLAEDGQPETGYDVPGMLHLAWDEADLAQLPASLATFRQRVDEGHSHLGAVQEISPAEAVERFPPLATPLGALWLPEVARVDGRLLRDALRQAVVHHGATIRTGEALPVVESGKVRAVRVGEETIATGAVVVAGGAWSGELGEVLGMPVPVAPQRGQIAHLHFEGQHTGLWPVISGYRSTYMLTFPPDRVVVGPTRETGSGFDPRVTAAGAHSILTTALETAPGLAPATLGEIRVGLRPASPDGLPILGAMPGLDGIVLATGFGPSGLQLGPLSGALMADLALGKSIDPAIDLAAFSIDRFAV